jgi:membrane-associated phospholipid phosphatase
MRSFIKLRALPALLPLLVSAAEVAPAQEAARYRIRPWPEGVALGFTAAAAWAPLLLGAPDPSTICPCDSARVPRFDRIAIGPVAMVPDFLSDAGMYGTALGGAALAYGLAPRGGGAEDLAVYAQAVGVTVVATNLLKVVTRRPRPYLYAGATPEHADDAYSFPSGHTSVAFAAAAAWAGIETRRGRGGDRAAVTAGLFATATLTGAFRVATHKHFPSDVVAGAILGTALGLVVPRLPGMR